jgi:hypothetical protein
MAKSYDEALILCPFFLSCGKKSISCEGITDDCTIFLRFDSKQKRDQHQKIFCNAKYDYCELFEIINRKYEE